MRWNPKTPFCLCNSHEFVLLINVYINIPPWKFYLLFYNIISKTRKKTVKWFIWFLRNWHRVIFDGYLWRKYWINTPVEATTKLVLQQIAKLSAAHATLRERVLYLFKHGLGAKYLEAGVKSLSVKGLHFKVALNCLQA